jgi:hypothetical protein
MPQLPQQQVGRKLPPVDSRATAKGGEYSAGSFTRMNRLITLLLALMAYGCVSTLETAEQAAEKQLLRFEKDGRFGFKDEAGRVVIQPVWDDATEFTEGLAQVSDGQGRRFIDTQGKTVITIGAACSAGRLSEGLIPVYIDRSQKIQDWQTRFINPQGESVFTVDGYASEFHEGMSVVVVRDPPDMKQPRYGFINHDGEVVITPQFAEALDFHEGLAGVRTTKTTGWYGKGDSWGYIDQTGNYVLQPTYNEVHPFCNGVARVHVGGKLREYAIHAPPVWEGGEWQLINRKGEVLKRNSEWVDYPEVR